MNMTREELREKVAEKLRHTYGEDKWLAFADAAIALVLEEAAKKLEALPEKVVIPGSLPIKYAWFGPKQCAAAIRALGGKP